MRAAQKAVLVVIVALLQLVLLPTFAQAYSFLTSCGPTWKNLPVQYLLNEKGSRDFDDFAELESIIETSFQTWQEPCCSGFRAEYIGTTEQTETTEPGPVVVAFAEDFFPAHFGGENTIAITYSMLQPDCTIDQSMILFNGANHRFFRAETDEIDEEDERRDLESIMTHEIGHLLGLDHSHHAAASMYPTYAGGTGPRTLSPDDVRGACLLYPLECACTKTEGCLMGQACNNGVCEDVPCTLDAQCGGSLVCLDGKCLEKPCTLHSECDPGFRCNTRVCVSKCPTCRICKDNGECEGGICLNFGQDFSRCVVPCDADGTCRGDAVCVDASDEDDDEPFYLCVNADYETEDLCPEAYVCLELDSDEEQVTENPYQPRKIHNNSSCASAGHSQVPLPNNKNALLLGALLAAAYARKRKQHARRG